MKLRLKVCPHVFWNIWSLIAILKTIPSCARIWVPQFEPLRKVEQSIRFGRNKRRSKKTEKVHIVKERVLFHPTWDFYVETETFFYRIIWLIEANLTKWLNKLYKPKRTFPSLKIGNFDEEICVDKFSAHNKKLVLHCEALISMDIIWNSQRKAHSFVRYESR